MRTRIRLSKAAREDLTKEAVLYEQTWYFIMTFDPTKVLDIALKNIDTVLRDLDAILFKSSCPFVDDVSSIIIKNKSKVENELIYIIDKTYDIETEKAFKEFLLHFQQGDLSKYRPKVYYSRYAPVHANGKLGTKEKAPQLTKLQRKQQKDDEDKRRVYLEKLDKESRDYNATLRFMFSFINKEQVPKEEHCNLLINAYSNIIDVESDLRYFIKSHEVSCDKDVSLILNGYRSKVENELQGICDNVSDLTIQQAFTQHLDDFRTGFKLSAQDRHSHLQNEDKKIMPSKPKTSVKKKMKKSRFRLRGKGRSGSCKTLSLIDLMHMNDYLREPRHDHSKCCMKKKNNFENYHPETIVRRPRVQEEILARYGDLFSG